MDWTFPHYWTKKRMRAERIPEFFTTAANADEKHRKETTAEPTYQTEPGSQELRESACISQNSRYSRRDVRSLRAQSCKLRAVSSQASVFDTTLSGMDKGSGLWKKRVPERKTPFRLTLKQQFNMYHVPTREKKKTLDILRLDRTCTTLETSEIKGSFSIA